MNLGCSPFGGHLTVTDSPRENFIPLHLVPRFHIGFFCAIFFPLRYNPLGPALFWRALPRDLPSWQQGENSSSLSSADALAAHPYSSICSLGSSFCLSLFHLSVFLTDLPVLRCILKDVKQFSSVFVAICNASQPGYLVCRASRN